ncbi:hypothetical protein Q2T41_17485 [Maribacter confluentis]|uniref:DKNYY family protein n=2 Tax=Maribacter TaxID=252356 RepID=A0ABY1SJJ5_9FLAO|nr:MULTISPECIES: DUF6607 family protein [Maribacter]MDO1514449.1 hypothetical protein [Maribacter confluentis]SNR64858.1 hypothetical protein SAMN04488009_2960 [Maribacter sedimenticola]
MKTPLYFLIVLFVSGPIIAQKQKKKQDINAIKSMCGCYEVTFNFAETFHYSNDSLYKPSKTKVDKGLEWAQLIVDEDDKISIQHLLQVGDPSAPHIVKHWRQDWLYQNTDLYTYNANNTWSYTNLPADKVKGQWTQKVYQVDDSPRYEGSSSWVHVDGKSFWENTADAPLPRREYTTRSDYNLTVRGNRQEITEYGWLHDQDNAKVIREPGKEDIVLAKEKGYNTYVKVDDGQCAAAANWWKKNADKWALVRTKWDQVYGRNKDLTLAEKVDHKVLYKYLFDEGYEDQAKINQVIESFVKN